MDPIIEFQTTSVAELAKLYDIFDISFDLEDSSFKVWFTDVGLDEIGYSAVKTLSADYSEIERIVLSCFLEKRIMWKDLRQYLADDCISSLIDLSVKLEEYRSHFDQDESEAAKLLSGLILLWSMECTQAKNEFDRANFNDDPQEGDYFDNPPDVESEIVPIIGDFRAKTLNIAKAFIDLLPEDHQLHKKAEMTYYKALSELVRYYNINLDDVSALKWKLELVRK